MHDSPVITGCGVVGPAGLGTQRLWQAAQSGRSLIGPLPDSLRDRLPIRLAGVVPPDVESKLCWPEFRVASLMALAADEAIAAAGWDAAACRDDQTAMCGATSKGDPAVILATRSGRHSAERFLAGWPNGPGRMLANRLGIGGPLICPVAACATGTHALVRAAQMIRDGDARRVLVVAGDASLSPLLTAAFANMGVLTDDACRPFDAGRSGFAVAEGAAAVTLESSRHAIGRAIVDVTGWLIGGDPTGLTAQDATGGVLAESIRILLRRARLDAVEVSLYSAHGTATRLNDVAEAAAMRSVFAGADSQPAAFAGKAIFGHLLGAAGLTEVVLSILAAAHQSIPPTVTLRTLDPACDGVRLVARVEPARIENVLCVSLGFGGQIGLLAMRYTG